MKYLHIFLLFVLVFFTFFGCNKKNNSSANDTIYNAKDEDGIFVDGVVIDKYILIDNCFFKGDFVVAIKNKSGKKVFIHSKLYYDMYNIGDEVRINLVGTNKQEK